jgi:hypothetical protein
MGSVSDESMGLSFTIASAVILGSESRGTRDYILLSQIKRLPFLSPPTTRRANSLTRSSLHFSLYRLPETVENICSHGNVFTQPLAINGLFLRCGKVCLASRLLAMYFRSVRCRGNVYLANVGSAIRFSDVRSHQSLYPSARQRGCYIRTITARVQLKKNLWS